MHRYQPSPTNVPYIRTLTLNNGRTIKVTSYKPLTMVWSEAIQRLPKKQYTYVWPNPQPKHRDRIVDPIYHQE